MKKLSRIYILGTSGSGKSYLADILSKKLDIPRYDLDDILWHVKYTKKRKTENRIKRLKPLARKKKWILEGVYGSWIEDALKKADVVIHMDTKIGIVAWRIIKRYFKRRGQRQEKLIDTLKLVKYASTYKTGTHTSSYKSHLELMKKHKLKKVTIKNKKQLAEFLEKVK